jgi:hypothetical protein
MLYPYKPERVRCAIGGGMSSAPGGFSVVGREGGEPIGGAHFIGFDQEAGVALYDVRVIGKRPAVYILTTDGRFEEAHQ